MEHLLVLSFFSPSGNNTSGSFFCKHFLLPSIVSSLKFASDNAKLKILQENALEEPFLFLTHLIMMENFLKSQTNFRYYLTTMIIK